MYDEKYKLYDEVFASSVVELIIAANKENTKSIILTEIEDSEYGYLMMKVAAALRAGYGYEVKLRIPIFRYLWYRITKKTQLPYAWKKDKNSLIYTHTAAELFYRPCKAWWTDLGIIPEIYNDFYGKEDKR